MTIKTRTGSQRYNARMERIWDESRATQKRHRTALLALLITVQDNADQIGSALRAGFIDDQFRLTAQGEQHLAELRELLR